MDFIGSDREQLQEMLRTIGVEKVEELFEAVPSSLMLPAPERDDGMSEWEGRKLIERIAAQNSFGHYDSFLGAGAYDHQTLAIVGAICAKSEFLSSYTPYQAEISQGLLQALFEFQSAICALTGLEVANGSVYDGGSACAEAALMALRALKGRKKLFISHLVHPHYRAIVEQYVEGYGAEVCLLPMDRKGMTDLQQAQALLDEEGAALLFQSPNFLGIFEEGEKLSALAHQKGMLSILCANPLSYGLFASSSDQGADIAVGDCQPLGLPLQFGGPYAGYMATTSQWMRQLPGRIVGRTEDSEGRSGYVLTLQAREQHIRREKATSNICTNQALAALASLTTILWYGAEGLAHLAKTNWQRASFLKRELDKLPALKTLGGGRCFNEFVVTFPMDIEEVVNHFQRWGICPGVPLDRWYPELGESLLVCVTETKGIEQLQRYLEVAEMIV